MEKSVLIPTQRVIYLGMVTDLLTMTSSLPKEKVSAIVQKATLLKNKNQVSVRDIYQFIGMCSATRLAIKGSSNPLSTASTRSDNLSERKFTLKKPVLLSENHTSFPCPARSGLVDTQSFHLNFESNYTSSSRHFHSDKRFRPGVGRLPETLIDFENMDKVPTFLAHKHKGIDGNFSQSTVFPKIPGEYQCSNNDRQLNKCVLSKPYGRDKINHSFKSGIRHLEMVPTKSYPHFSSTCYRSSEHLHRSTLPLSTVEHRVDAIQENIPIDRGSFRMSSDRSLCLIPKPPTKNILFLDSRPKSLSNRCILVSAGIST